MCNGLHQHNRYSLFFLLRSLVFLWLLLLNFYRTGKTCLPLCWKCANTSRWLCWRLWVPATAFLQLSTRISLPSIWVSVVLLHIIAKQTFALKDFFSLLKIIILFVPSTWLYLHTIFMYVYCFTSYQLTFHFCWVLSDGDGL